MKSILSILLTSLVMPIFAHESALVHWHYEGALLLLASLSLVYSGYSQIKKLCQKTVGKPH